MPYSFYNPNPLKSNTRDCAVRAVAKALDISWEESFAKIASMAFSMGQTMDYDASWGAVLRMNGFRRDIIPNTCPECYTIRDFCKDHNTGVYVLATGNHVATVVNGVLYDTSDTGNEIPQYYWYEAEKGDQNGTAN